MKPTSAVLVGLASICAASIGSMAWAEQTTVPTPIEPLAATALPGADEVRVLIAGLDSVRDYDRLRYVLNAIDGQPASARAALLAELDERVLRITQADAEARAASALATAKLFAPATPTPQAAPAGRSAGTTKEGSERQETTTPSSAAEVLSLEQSLARMRAARREGRALRSATEIRHAIGEVSPGVQDPKDMAKQLREIHLDIAGVEDQTERLELYKSLGDRSREIAQLADAKAKAAREALQSASPSPAGAQHP
jgi:hypothetical protein